MADRLGSARLPLAVLCLTSLFARIDDAALGVLLPQIRSEFGVSLTFLGTLGSVVGVVYTLTFLPFGYLADRVKRVWLVRAGTLATGAAVTAQGLAGSVPALAAARVATGVALGVAPPASFPLLADYLRPAVRTRAFAYYFAAAQAGLVVGPVVAGLLGDRFGWRPVLVGFGLAATLSGLLCFLLREPPRGAFERAPDSPEQRPLPFGEAYRAAARIATLRRLWYATPLLNARGVFIFLVLPVYLADVYSVTPTSLGIVQTLVGAGGLAALVVAGPLGDRILSDQPGRYMTLMGLAPVIQCLLIGVLLLHPPLPGAVAAIVVLAVFETALQPAFYTLISLVVPARSRGLGLATSAPWQLLGLVGAPFLLHAVDTTGIEHGIALFIPFLLLGALVLGTGAAGVERDIRAARASDAADAAARRTAVDGRTPLLVCRDVSVEYGGVRVLSGVDLEIGRGETVALLGTNGAGKSTLLRALCGLTPSSDGAAFLDGQDITALPPHRIAGLGVALMPGGAAVLPSMSVRENLLVAGRDLTTVLDLFPALSSRLDERAGDLSGGEQQMVGLAQALLLEPRLLLVDELSLGLAPAVVESLADVLRRLRENGTSVVLVEQSLNVATRLAERAVFLDKGQVQYDGPTAELLSRGDLVRSVFLARAATGTRPARRTPTAGTPVLQVDDVHVRYGGVSALAGVSIEARPGEVVGVIGPNGAGKTTLFDVISGFVRPDSGSVRLAGDDVTALTPDARARRGLGRSFQSARLFPALTVRDTIAVALDRAALHSTALAAVRAPQLRASERRIARRVDLLIGSLGLGPYADVPVAELSTGTRRAVDLACVLAFEPSVLLLDEPSSGLAHSEVAALGPLLSRIVKETGCALLLIEHDVPLVLAVSDNVVAMETGRVLAAGAPEHIRTDPRVIASYLSATPDLIERNG